MTWYQGLMLFGFPSLCVTIISLVARRITKMIKTKEETEKQKERDDGYIRAGIQALLRTKMIDIYNKWSEKGYAPIYAKENFENMYKAYHNLGFNGVMDGTRESFMALPTEPPERGKAE